MIKKYKVIMVLFAVSSTVLLFIFNFNIIEALPSIILQLIGSGLIGFVFTQLYNKYYKSSHLKWWTIFYDFRIYFLLFIRFFSKLVDLQIVYLQ